MERILSKEEMEKYLEAVAAQIHTVDKSTISVNLLARKNCGELSDDEYHQLMAGLHGNPDN